MNQQDAALVLDMLMLMERTSLTIYQQRIKEAISIMAPLAQPYVVSQALGIEWSLRAKDLKEARTWARRQVADYGVEVWIQKKGKIVEIWRRGADGKPERSL